MSKMMFTSSGGGVCFRISLMYFERARADVDFSMSW